MWNAHFNSLNALRHDTVASVYGLDASDAAAVAAFEQARAATIDKVVRDHGEDANVTVSIRAYLNSDKEVVTESHIEPVTAETPADEGSGQGETAIVAEMPVPAPGLDLVSDDANGAPDPVLGESQTPEAGA